MPPRQAFRSTADFTNNKQQGGKQEQKERGKKKLEEKLECLFWLGVWRRREKSSERSCGKCVPCCCCFGEHVILTIAFSFCWQNNTNKKAKKQRQSKAFSPEIGGKEGHQNAVQFALSQTAIQKTNGKHGKCRLF